MYHINLHFLNYKYGQTPFIFINHFFCLETLDACVRQGSAIDNRSHSFDFKEKKL